VTISAEGIVSLQQVEEGSGKGTKGKQLDSEGEGDMIPVVVEADDNGLARPMLLTLKGWEAEALDKCTDPIANFNGLVTPCSRYAMYCAHSLIKNHCPCTCQTPSPSTTTTPPPPPLPPPSPVAPLPVAPPSGCTDPNPSGLILGNGEPLPCSTASRYCGTPVIREKCPCSCATPPSPSPPSSDDCVGAGSIQRGSCLPCRDNMQCGGGFCCPYMKKCVTSSRQPCGGPIAECRPTCHSGDCPSCHPSDGTAYADWGKPTCTLLLQDNSTEDTAGEEQLQVRTKLSDVVTAEVMPGVGVVLK